MRNRIASCLVGIVFVLGACDGGSTGGTTNATGGTGGNGVGGNDVGGNGGMNGSTPCPASEPTNGVACTTPNLQCSYGDGAFPMCRHKYRCDLGKWAQNGGFCQQEPLACSPSPVEGTACPGQGSYCFDGTKLCMCPVCGGAGCPPEPWSWSCGAAPAAGCPDFVPNDGTACNVPALVCEYGINCNEHARAQCINGTWIWDPEYPCP
jgi:hypothetical protein